MIIYVDNPENCKIKVGDTLKHKDPFRLPVLVTEIRRIVWVDQPKTPNFRCPHCDGDLDDYMEE